MRINRVIVILLWFLFVVNMGESLFAPVLAVYVTGSIVGATLATIGFSVAIYSLVKSAIQLVIAKKLDKRPGERDDFYALLAGSVIGAIYAFGLAGITTISGLYLLSALNGVGGAALMAAYYAIFAHHADRDKEGFEWSLFSVWGLTVSTAVGASVGGLAVEWFGFTSTFITAGCLQILATLLILFLYPKLNTSKTT